MRTAAASHPWPGYFLCVFRDNKKPRIYLGHGRLAAPAAIFGHTPGAVPPRRTLWEPLKNIARKFFYRLLYRHFGPDVLVLIVCYREAQMSRCPRAVNRWQEFCALSSPVRPMKLAVLVTGYYCVWVQRTILDPIYILDHLWFNATESTVRGISFVLSLRPRNVNCAPFPMCASITLHNLCCKAVELVIFRFWCMLFQSPLNVWVLVWLHVFLNDLFRLWFFWVERYTYSVQNSYSVMAHNE